MNGVFCWFDLSTTDSVAAQDFYSKLLGWTTTGNGGGTNPYTMWKAGEQTFGGSTALSETAKAMGVPSHWMGYIWVADVDAAEANCTRLGGKVIVPGTDLEGNAGRFAVLADPQGAIFALYQTSNPDQAGEWKSPVSWHECYTTNVDAAWAFYEGMFGWAKTDSMQMPEGGVYQMFGIGGKTMGGMMVKPAAMPATAWLYYFNVDDADAKAAKVASLGGKVVVAPMDIPGGDRIAILQDPQGAAFAVHSVK